VNSTATFCTDASGACCLAAPFDFFTAGAVADCFIGSDFLGASARSLQALVAIITKHIAKAA
jgi:hypothetical protein